MVSDQRLDNETKDMVIQALGFKSVKVQHSKNKGLSRELEQKIRTANHQWGKAKQSILDVYHQALTDGWTEVEAAKICKEKLTIFSPRTIQRILPDQAKNQTMKRGRAYKQIADNCPQLTSDTTVTIEEKQPEIKQQLHQLEEKEEQQDIQPQPVGWIAQNFEQVEPVEVTPPTTTEAAKQLEPEAARNGNKINWDNNNDIRLVSYNVDSYSQQECRRLLKESLNQLLSKQGEISQLKSSLKVDRESYTKHYKGTRDLKKYNICELCDKKGTGKYYGHLYCAKHLKQNLELNENLSPMINNVMGRVMGVK